VKARLPMEKDFSGFPLTIRKFCLILRLFENQ